MKVFLLFFIFSNFLLAFDIKECKDYTKTTTHIVGISPPINMMIQSIKAYSFPKKISKNDKVFKKLVSIEELLNKKVDLVVLWNSTGNYQNLAFKLNKVGIDTCSINLVALKNYIQGYKVLGKIMDKGKRANKLANYIEKELDKVNEIKRKIPNSEVLKVYYAKSNNGLLTECEDSIHAEAIKLIGAKNPIKCNGIKNMRININLEQLFMINPDVIITNKKKFYEHVFTSKKLKHIKAVKNKKVFLIPKEPINWIDNPPSFFKSLGILWLGSKIYPKYYKEDLKKQKKEFEALFLNRSSDGKL